MYLYLFLTFCLFCVINYFRLLDRNSFPRFVKDNGNYFSYVLYPYQRITRYTNNFYPSSSVLAYSFQCLNAPKVLYNFTNQVQAEVGINQTVWGLKKDGSEYSWEYYFYYPYQNPKKEVNSILHLVTKHFNTDTCMYPSNNPEFKGKDYFMFSLDLDRKLCSDKKLNNLDIYLGVKGYGNSYAWDPNDSLNLTHKNTYYFFKPNEVKELKKRFYEITGEFFPRTRMFNRYIMRYLLNSQISICLAIKPKSYCLYASGIPVNDLISFLYDLDYPQSFQDAIKSNHGKLDGLLFDVGVNFLINPFRIIKSGIYGTF